MSSNGRALDLEVVSNRGAVRAENQDAALAWTNDGGETCVVVSDGMGGHARGREAAEIVVRTCQESLQSPNGEPWPRVLAGALRTAHLRVLEAAQSLSGPKMGATVILACVDSSSSPPVLNLAHVGDSRAYLFRGNSIYRLTSDHSLVAQLVRDGHLTEVEAFGHPDSNILQQAIGQSGDLDPEVAEIKLDSGDVVILCSDGLHGVVPDDDLLKIVRGSGSSAETCHNLVAAALSANSEDNISVACLRFPSSSGKRRPTRPSG